jgi:hypothetical protein
MINVRVRKHYSIDVIDRNGKSQILLVTLAASSLKESAVEEDGLARDTEYVTGPSDFASGADEFNLHDSLDER